MIVFFIAMPVVACLAALFAFTSMTRARNYAEAAESSALCAKAWAEQAERRKAGPE